MGYEFDPNRYEGDEEPSTADKAPCDAQKDDKNKTSNSTGETNKDVDSSGGISELKVNIYAFNCKNNFVFTHDFTTENIFDTFLRHFYTPEIFYLN